MTAHIPAGPNGINERGVRELSQRYAGRFSREEIAACLASATADLRGSVASPDGLPELAIRLAAVRLEAMPGAEAAVLASAC